MATFYLNFAKKYPVKQFYTVPIFIPELACPHRCVFCNQHSITSVLKTPTLKETQSIIEKYLSTIPDNKTVDIGFLGGNFTGIPVKEQEAYLQTAQPYLRSGKVSGIRVSTRPDYISKETLGLLKNYGVSTIELGAQSMDESVLQNAGRGHTTSDTREASAMIKASGISLGLQMMTGLPGDTPAGAKNTAKEIIGLGADNTRIYPTLVVKGTHLQTLWRQGKYQPQTLEETLDLLSELIPLFRENNVDILRVGLHPTEGFLSGDDLLAGPFHPSLKALALSRMWKERLHQKTQNLKANAIKIGVNPKDIPHAVGHQSENKKWLLTKFGKVDFVQDTKIKEETLHVDYC